MNTQSFIQSIHKSMMRKISKSGEIKDDIVLENRLFALLCQDSTAEPRIYAQKLTEQYGYNLTGNNIIQIFRRQKMANPIERAELFVWANEIATLFAEVEKGSKDALEVYERKRKEPALQNGKHHNGQERMAILAIYEMYPELNELGDRERLHTLGNTLSKYFFYEVCDLLQNSAVNSNHNNELSQLKETNQRLKQALERSNAMLQDLQQEFAEQLELSKITELTEFFAKLNSEKYGCILDELLSLRKGMEELRKNQYELPLVINGLFVMVRKLIQFIQDSRIEPIFQPNSCKDVTAKEIEHCQYDGSPFLTDDEIKTVRVVAPGWIYKEKQIQIACPKVKEEIK